MYLRNQTNSCKVGNLILGGNDKVYIQSMTNTKTSDVESTVKQINLLAEAGCDIIRVACLNMDDARAIAEIKKRIHIPLVADIHFDPNLAIEAIKQGVDKIRLNPGNISNTEKIKEIVRLAKEHNVAIRIGVNGGSLPKGMTLNAKNMIEACKMHTSILEELDFHNIVISLKASNVALCKEAYELASQTFPYPLHVGITEAGTTFSGLIKSAIGISSILALGIGNTIRVSLTDDPIYEVRAAKEIENYLYTVKKDIHVAVMGCVVNGPGEAREADLGVAGGIGEALLFKKGEIIRKIKEEDIVKELIKEIDAF